MIIKVFVNFLIGGLLCFQSVLATGKTTVIIGYAELEKDPRYIDKRL
ncbi:uncharacterized protein METZ01_LOCUS314022, partial [marine metagenome]